MENVNDLKVTKPDQKVTTLSNIIDDNKNAINIDATDVNNSNLIEQEKTNRPIVKISANMAKRSRKTITDQSQIQRVDPNTIIEKPSVQAEYKPSIQEKALNELEEAVNRKQKEYKDFIEYAVQADKEHREAIENGLETVNGELQYMPNELYTPISEEDKITNPSTFESSDTNIYSSSDENFEDNDVNGTSFTYPTSTDSNAVVGDLFSTDNNFIANDGTLIGANNYNIESEEVEDINNDEDYVSNDDLLEWVDSDNAPAIEDNIESKESVNQIVEEEKEVVEVNNDESDSLNHINNNNDAIKYVADSGFNINSPNFTDEEMFEKTSSSDFDIDEADLDDLDYSVQENEDDLSEEEIRSIAEESDKHLRNEILQKIIQAGKKVDTSQFVVSNKIINIKQALRTNENKKVERTASWPMTFAGRLFISTPLKGPEIVLLSDFDDVSRRNTFGNITIDQAKIMYEHDANPFKPTTFESWCKTIPAGDVENIFAAMYKATMNGSNYVPRICSKPSCQYSYLEENLDIEKMVKFDNDESREWFEKVKTIEPTAENSGQYQSVVSVINDRFAVGLKIPSLYTLLYEYSNLSEDFMRKYYGVIGVIQYIDYIYYINPDTMQYEPIGWKTYIGDNAKTFKSKIATYSKILKEFDDSDFSILIALINSINHRTNDSRMIRYEIPETKCPKCGSTIEALPIIPRELVFMRQRLVELVTTPTER